MGYTYVGLKSVLMGQKMLQIFLNWKISSFPVKLVTNWTILMGVGHYRQTPMTDKTRNYFLFVSIASTNTSVRHSNIAAAWLDVKLVLPTRYFDAYY